MIKIKGWELLKEIAEGNIKEIFVDYDYDDITYAIRIALNLIEKQQREIEKLKNDCKKCYVRYRLDEYIDAIYTKNEFVSKVKIKDKIKEKQNKISKLHSASDCVIIDDLETEINAYKELLEEQ